MGSHMVELLAAAGHEVVATDAPRAWIAGDRRSGRYPGVVRALGVRCIEADVTRPESLDGLPADLDFVFHIAGVFSYSAPWSLLRAVNVDGTRALVDRVLRDSPGLRRMVVWGAGGVYGLPGPDEQPVDEKSPPAPPNDYLRSKWFEEHLVMRAGEEKGLPWTIIRPTTVYGPRAVYGGGQLLMGPASMPVAAVPRNLAGRIPFVHVRDVCGAALHLAGVDAARGEAYNVSDDSRLTGVEFMRLVAETTGRRFVELPAVPVETLRRVLAAVADALQAAAARLHFPSPLEKPTVEYLGRDLVFANDKLKSTGYRFEYPDAREGIRETLEWYRKEGWIR